jgi:ribosomal protein S4E
VVTIAGIRNSEKTLAISNQDGTQTELTISQQQFVKNYLKLSIPKQKLVSDLVFELTELNMSTSSRLDLTQ